MFQISVLHKTHAVPRDTATDRHGQELRRPGQIGAHRETGHFFLAVRPGDQSHSLGKVE